MKKDSQKNKHVVRNVFFVLAGFGFAVLGIIFVWVSTLSLPDFESFENLKIGRSTKIYDSKGEVVLYDLNQNFRRTVAPLTEMGSYIKNATIAIEDSNFYTHKGVRPRALIRAFVVNLSTGKFSQGGSTITQQIIKNTLLTKDKTITRKIKEWVLALKIERVMSKDEILATYLNDSPYGGSIYGVVEASRAYFKKKPSELTLTESAYLAAIPKAPTYYSPYGSNRERLEERKNLVLSKMFEQSMITEEEYKKSKEEVVEFTPDEEKGIKAPHFVFFIKEYLVEKYGEEVVSAGGLTVTTTLDWALQEKAEEIVKRHALENDKKYNAENAGLVALDPKTGQIIAMVGSRDYFDEEIDGNYNIATAKRQPGSSFKPFVYARGLIEGYTPETVLFDTETEFNASCSAYGAPGSGVSSDECYTPQNFNGEFNGPLTMRQALGRSINVPAVKMLYLVGVNDSIKLAEDLGIKTLVDERRYGLSLVLGGGEVRLLDMTSAYGVFANNGVKNEPTGILKITDSEGNILEEYTKNEEQVLEKNIALTINDMLKDNEARLPTFAQNSPMYFPNYEVAVKTGTTNNFKDGWIVGYTPNIAVGVWVGNNNNTPMGKVSSVGIAGPLWHEFMNMVLTKIPKTSFEKPLIEDNSNLKPVLRGVWQGGESYTIDTISGGLATEFTPEETKKIITVTNVHDILYWVQKGNPRGPKPENPYTDSQFSHWEISVQNWWGQNSSAYQTTTGSDIPTYTDNIHTATSKPQTTIISPINFGTYPKNQPLSVLINYSGSYPLLRMDVFLNDSFIGTSNTTNFTFTPSNITSLNESQNELKILIYDQVFNRSQNSIQISFSEVD